MKRFLAFVLATAITLPASAGMPAPIQLSDIGRARFQTISFFLAVLVVSAIIIRLLWNKALRPNFPRLPLLSFWKAMGIIVLWGLLFSVVLTMISGARELMTPGAWEKHGVSYRLVPGTQP